MLFPINRNKKTLVFLIIVFLLSRLIIAYTSIDLADPIDVCYIGTVANEIRDGLKQPYIDYQHQAYYGNTLITPFIAAFLFLIFGKTTFSLLLVGIILSLGMLIAIYLLVEKFFDNKAAFYASILFILSPSSYTVRSFLVGHGHIHITLFIIISLFFFLDFFYSDKKISLILAGSFSGFGIFFSNIFLFILPPCLLLWFTKDQLFFLKKEFFIFIFFLILGLTPFFYYNIQNDFIGINQIKYGFNSNYLSLDKVQEITNKFTNLLLYDIPNSFNFREIIFQREILNYSYYIIFLFLIIYLLYKNYRYLINIPFNYDIIPSNNIKQLFILFVVIFFFLIYIVSNFSFDGAIYSGQYRYLMPLFPFIFICMAISLLEIYKSNKMVFIFLFSFLIIIGLISNFGLISSNLSFEKESNPKPLCYNVLGFVLGAKNKLQPDKAFESCGKLKEEYRDDCYNWVGIGVTDAIGYYNFNTLKNSCSKINETHRNNCYLGIGYVTSIRYRFENNKSLIDKDCNSLEEEYRPYCYRGVGWFTGWYNGYYPEQGGLVCEKLDKKYNKYCYIWLGYVIGEIKGDIKFGIKDCKKYKEYSSLCCKGLLEYKNQRIDYFNESKDYCNVVLGS
ncbi:glycosyltransferase family 39 protein [Candidatus Woesearchaeota archaeon]|nr:glycosyltransferase family 39 protein [Candidatus Woesearchaeota archaeon]